MPGAVIINADIWEYCENRRFDVIILSNILEHLDRRIEILDYLNRQFRPREFLIRVPLLQREWLVQYKMELGIEWRLDLTHKIEYTEDELCKELEKAGLFLKRVSVKWGEMYAVAGAYVKKA